MTPLHFPVENSQTLNEIKVLSHIVISLCQCEHTSKQKVTKIILTPFLKKIILIP
jgi:hypothetical protein